MVAASFASERSSCISSSTCLPLIPPAALTSSAASLMPLTDEIPKFAVVPVVDIKTPMRTLSPDAAGLQANEKSRLPINIRLNEKRFICPHKRMDSPRDLRAKLLQKSRVARLHWGCWFDGQRDNTVDSLVRQIC